MSLDTVDKLLIGAGEALYRLSAEVAACANWLERMSERVEICSDRRLRNIEIKLYAEDLSMLQFHERDEEYIGRLDEAVDAIALERAYQAAMLHKRIGVSFKRSMYGSYPSVLALAA